MLFIQVRSTTLPLYVITLAVTTIICEFGVYVFCRVYPGLVYPSEIFQLEMDYMCMQPVGFLISHTVFCLYSKTAVQTS